MTDTFAQDPQSRELKALRVEIAQLKTALGEDAFRLRRLAELGTAQAKLNHDLRNIMASALMVADRLSGSEDPKVGRSGKIIVAALEQASALIATTLDFATEKEPVLTLSRFPLADLIEELTAEINPQFPHVLIESRLAADVAIEADHAQMLRAFGHLLRTAAKAQAKTIIITAEQSPEQLRVILRDDGRPFRDPNIANPMSAFSGAFRYGSSGLGLVIARELIEAHGGRVALLAESNAEATVMEITLPL